MATYNTAHHVQRLTCLCRHHHRAVHEGGFRVEGQAPDALRFYTPQGALLPAAPALPELPLDPVANLQSLHADEGLHIDPRTLGTWLGDSMDYDMALQALHHADTCGEPFG